MGGRRKGERAGKGGRYNRPETTKKGGSRKQPRGLDRREHGREHERGGEDKYVAFGDKNLRNSKKSTKFAADLRNSRKSKVERPQACLLKAES